MAKMVGYACSIRLPWLNEAVRMLRENLPEAEYNAEKDVTKYPGVKSETLVNCKPGEFAIFWPQDGHKPCIGTGDIHKAIFKVRV